MLRQIVSKKGNWKRFVCWLLKHSHAPLDCQLSYYAKRDGGYWNKIVQPEQIDQCQRCGDIKEHEVGADIGSDGAALVTGIQLELL